MSLAAEIEGKGPREVAKELMIPIHEAERMLEGQTDE